jgi:hypothetical protein
MAGEKASASTAKGQQQQQQQQQKQGGQAQGAQPQKGQLGKGGRPVPPGLNITNAVTLPSPGMGSVAQEHHGWHRDFSVHGRK